MPTTPALSVTDLNKELAAADASLVGNDALLLAILAGSGDCIKILDLDGRLQFMSEGGKRVMEVDDFGALKGCPWPDFWESEGNTAVRQAIDAGRRGDAFHFTGTANTAKGNERYWDVQVLPVRGADGRPTHLLSISRDISDLRASEQRERMLTEEMRHRVKNTMAMVSAISRQTLQGEDIADRRRAFDARLFALSKTLDLLSLSAWTETPIHQVLDTALAAHASSKTRFVFDGPEINLSAHRAQSLALAVHELATNAVKYGALSVDKGSVHISWRIGADNPGAPRFTWVWRELGGPPVSPPEHKGFGSSLIGRVLAADFGGSTGLDYRREGLVCTLVATMSPPEAR